MTRYPLEPNARSFAWAYPVVTKELEIRIENKTAFDMFLLYGGYVYYDKDDELIQCNSLWPGGQLQFATPAPLPPALDKQIEDEQRWHDITLEPLHAVGARQFAWLPPKYTQDIAHGGFAYRYEDRECNNYFVIASAASVAGMADAGAAEDKIGKLEDL